MVLTLRRVILIMMLAFLMSSLLATKPEAASYGPERDAETTLTTPFTWSDATQFSQYRFLVRRTDTSVIVHSTTINSNDPVVCPDGALCTLSPGTPRYPVLETRDYEWVVFGLNSSTGIWQWWGPETWSPFHPLPDKPSSFAAVWKTTEIDMTWPGVAGAISYEADFLHDLYKPATATFTCTALSCFGSENVSHIPYGTIRVNLRACGINGRCTEGGASRDVTSACPSTPSAPAILSPVPGAVLGGLVPVQFSHTAYSERFNISIVDNATASTVVQEGLGYKPLKCTKTSCSRVYPLTTGTYTVYVNSSCGGISSAPATASFTVNSAGAAPQMLAPTQGQETSAFPLIAWRKLLNIDLYEVELADIRKNSVRRQLVSCFTPTVCAFDIHRAGWQPVTGSHTAAVRVAGTTMPYSPSVTFHPSFSYSPPRPKLISPEQGSNTNAPNVTLTFSVDPQAPFVTAAIEGPGGFLAESAKIFRDSDACTLLLDGTLSLQCRYTTPLTAYGDHAATALAWTYTDAAGSSASVSARSLFLRPPPLTFGSPKATYSIYAQNMQFLPSSPLNGGASSAYGHSDASRADKLADYVFENNFDIVALSEVFTREAKATLNKRLIREYFGVSNIDTEGRVEKPLVFGAGFLGGWWLGPAGAAAVGVGTAKMLEDLKRQGNSGLAIYTKMPIVTHPGKGGTDNSRCTDDLFNKVSEYRPDNEDKSTPIGDLVWFRQYCKTAGIDGLSAKGIAAVELMNPYTGHPLLLAWSHTQAYARGSFFGDLLTGSYTPSDGYKKSYEARADQVGSNATSVIDHFVQEKYNDKPFDAFILGDWNIPSPASVSRVPQKGLDEKGKVVGLEGWADYGLMYGQPPTSDDGHNPTFDSLVGAENSPGAGIRLFDQYWRYFDPRNAARSFKDFHDLWLNNPVGDPGFTFDPSSNTVAKCQEVGEPCWGETPLTRGARYDTVLARFHATSIPALPHPESFRQSEEEARYPLPSNPGGGHPAWVQSKSCVQHVRLAKDFGLSDHWGTIIEVGPDAPFCGPNQAKPDPHLWRLEGSAPPPAPPRDSTYDSAAGRHQGTFAYGGANEWFFFSEAGGFDFIPLHKDSSIPQLRIDAYDTRDLSTMIPVADAEQKTNQSIAGTCPTAPQSIEANGYIPQECATSEQRITYRSPGPFFVRIRPADNSGRICDTCTGTYEILIRKRTCKVSWDAVLAAQGVSNLNNQGWFGQGQPRCWFSYELAKETLDSDHQQVVVADLYAANDALCQARRDGGTCSKRYDVFFYDAAPAADHRSIAPEPTEEINPSESFSAGAGERSLVTDPNWFKATPRMPGGVMPETGRRKFFAKVERDDPTRAHESTFPWNSNLTMTTYHSVSVSDIEDDLEIEVKICLPIIGCIIDNLADPFETEDEIRAWIAVVPAAAWYSFEIDDFGVDYAGAAGAQYPNEAPGGLPPGCKAYQRCQQPSVPEYAKGTTVNYTQTTMAAVFEKDSPTSNETVVGDKAMCGAAWPPPIFGWQGSYYRKRWEEIKNGAQELPHTWKFSDDCPDDNPQFNYWLQVLVPRAP